ncbi:MAG: DUF6884 domain-containing protein [Bacteroidota bacterium]
MRLLLITSCTKKKAADHPRRLTLDDFRDPGRLAEREREMAGCMLPAGRMYAGPQHVGAMRGVALLRQRFGREAVAVKILSAGYGLIDEGRLIAPYEATFKGMAAREAAAWAGFLNVAAETRAALRGFPLAVFLLGDKYLRAIEPPLEPEPGQRLIFLAKPGEAGALTRPGVTVVPAGKAEAGRYGAGLVFLKGRMFELFARGLAQEGEGVWRRLLGDGTAGVFSGLVEEGLSAKS